MLYDSKKDPNALNSNFFNNQKLIFARKDKLLVAANEMNHRPNFILNLETNEVFYASDYDVETNQEFIDIVSQSQKDN